MTRGLAGVLPAAVLFLLLGSPAAAQARLVEPNGASVLLQDSFSLDGHTLVFPPGSIPARSWLVLPVQTSVRQIRIDAREGSTILRVPEVSAPDPRIAFEVPATLRSVTFWGPLADEAALTRTPARPAGPAATWITLSPSDLRIDLPAWTTAPGFTPILLVQRTGPSPWEAAFSEGGRSLNLGLPGSVSEWGFAPPAWGFSPSRIVIGGGSASPIRVRLSAVAPVANLPADPKTILAWPPSRWRNPEREWFSWTGTSVLVLDTADYDIQARYLTRLAYYVEKPGFRGRLAFDAEIAGRHGWNAHDYSAPDLARFYTQAEAEAFPLNRWELELRQRLVSAGILIAKTEHSWEPGTGALVGISQESPPALRASLFVHEAFHGLYYTSPAFRDGVARAWGQLSEGAKAAFRSFLAHSQYDSSNEPLMINEFQAYLLQRSAADWKPFLRDRVLAKANAERTKVWLEEYLAATRSLDGLVHELYGLHSGTVSLVTVLAKPET